MRGPPLAALSHSRVDRLTQGVVAVALVALALRVVLLGARPSHYDEGRVAWWTMHFLETGQFEYRFIIHGPLVQHVNKVLFATLGAGDRTMRLFVALVGAALPLAALLFRERLADLEVLGVAAFLAVNPVLVYYSRFFRSTVLVAAFTFVAFGMAVRALDRRSLRYAHGAVLFLALAFTAKENAAVYVLCWVGATALVVDHLLFRTGGDESGLDWLFARVDRAALGRHRTHLPRYLGHLLLAGALFFAVTLYFYAPRSPTPGEVGFWDGITNPAQFPTMVERTLDDVVRGYEYWFGGSTDAGGRYDSLVDEYLSYLGQSLRSLGQYALPLMVLSAVGFAAERYARPRPRWLVLFAGYWGYVSVLGYPMGTDVYGAWIMVNALVPLAIPAGVGLALVLGWARETLNGDAVRFAIAAFLVFLLVGQLSLALVSGGYLNPTGEDNTLVQYAQPADDFRPAFDTLAARAETHEGADVLFVGESYVRDSPRRAGITPRCTSISETLPLQWYVKTAGATGDCVQSVDNASEVIASEDPILVIAPEQHQDALAPALDGYEPRIAGLRTYGSRAVFFVDRANRTAG
jgi:uncharacterized protein (TIGR03663 family)